MSPHLARAATITPGVNELAMRKGKNESLDNGTQIEFIFHFLYSREFNKLDSMEKDCREREFGRS